MSERPPDIIADSIEDTEKEQILIGAGEKEEDAKISKLSPDEIKENKRLATRANAFHPVLDKYIPNITIEEMNAIVAERNKESVTEMTTEDKKVAEYSLRVFNNEKKMLIESVAKSNIHEKDFEEYFSYVYQINKHPIERFSLKNLQTTIGAAQSLEQARLYDEFAADWKTRFVDKAKEQSDAKQKLGKLNQLIVEISGVSTYPRPPERGVEEMRKSLNAYTEFYSFNQSLPAAHPNNSRENSYSISISNTFIDGAWRAARSLYNPDQIRRVFDVYKQTAEIEDKKSLAVLAESVTRYARTHLLDENATKGFVQKLLPAIEHNDPQVAVLIRGGNIWGMGKNDFGVADFICHSYTTKVDPVHINELMLVSKEIPTTDLARLEQNRKDALSLSGVFGALRDFIHDQRPYVHEVMDAMVNFYDTGNDTKLLEILAKTDYLKSEEYKDRLSDKTKYTNEVPIGPLVNDVHGVPSQQKILVIDLLRRLQKNTEPAKEKPPKISDKEITQKISSFQEHSGEKQIARQEFGELLDKVNTKLEVMMNDHEVGIGPDFVLLLSWLDRQGFLLLQDINYEEQTGLYQQKWFTSILKFNALTTSGKNFSKEKFDDLVGEIKNKRSFQQAYELISKNILEHIYTLAKHYQASGRNDTGFLWSGNVTHELLGLGDFRKPTTELGKKFVREKEQQRIERDYHPGD